MSSMSVSSKRVCCHCRSAETVASIQDLLEKILLSLPPRSLIRFKSVSKNWLSLIPNLYDHDPKTSAFFSKKTDEKHFKFIPALANHESSSIGPDWNPFTALNKEVPEKYRDFRILQSCNGLFLCSATFDWRNDGKYAMFYEKRNPDKIYVVNPTTNEFLALSPPNLQCFMRPGLAFEPTKSPHYKVVCVFGGYNCYKHVVDIYSSETKQWKSIRFPPFPTPRDVGRHYDFQTKAMRFDFRSRGRAVYCNGAIHWIRKNYTKRHASVHSRRRECDVLHYFNVDEELFKVVDATPPHPQYIDSNYPRLVRRYFGESGCRLYLIEIFEGYSTQFEVMEMERDYKAWVVKYYVDLDPVLAALTPDKSSANFVVLNLCRDELDQEEEDISSFLLLQIPGKVIRYNLLKKTFHISVELTNEEFILEHKNYPYMHEEFGFCMRMDRNRCSYSL